jgi:signal transduction histidine kinase
MGASGLEQQVGKLFEAAGYEVSQAVGPDAGVVDWFATPRTGLSRPRTYFVAWERCPEGLDAALAELERLRGARGADRALGVVMEGGLPEGYQTDLARVTEAITYRRFSLEVSGIAARVREQVRRYEREQGPELYLPVRGRIESGETVDAAAYIKEWANGETTDNLLVNGSGLSLVTPIRHIVYERGVQFDLTPESVIPLVAYKPDDVRAPFDVGFAVPVVDGSRLTPPRAPRTLVYSDNTVHALDDDAHGALEGRRLEVAEPSPPELESWLHDHLDDHIYRRFMSARETEPAFDVLSTHWRNMHGLLVAMRAAPPSERKSTAEWIAHIVSAYMASISHETLDRVEATAFGHYALGVDSNDTEATKYMNALPSPPEEWVDNWAAYWRGEEVILNRLVRDYLLARRIAREVESHRTEILTRYQFPEKYVLLFLAVISPEAAARAAEIRAQIESEVERRLELTLSHQIRRSVGAIRMNVGAIREELTPEQEAKYKYELDRIEDELRFQSALASQTGRWRNVPNGPEQGVALREAITLVAAPLTHGYSNVRLEIDLDAALRVRARPAVLREILHCLLENAFHAVLFPPVQEPVIHVTARAVDETIVVEISDNGRGVTNLDRERIFEPFVTSKKGGSQPHGTGMGLAIARRWAENIGAEVGLDAERNGTCFFIRLIAWRDGS